MKILQWLQDGFQSVWNGVSRLFKPSDDNYPETGVQPFEGDPNSDSEQFS